MRFVTAEEGHVVLALPPQDIAGGAQSDVFSMEEWQHATILVVLGVTGAASTVKVQACDDFTPSNTEDIAFAVYKEETAGGDVLGAREAIADTGFDTSTEDNVFYAIEVDAAELPDDKPNLRLDLSDPGVATQAAVIVILSAGRYAGPESPTVLS